MFEPHLDYHDPSAVNSKSFDSSSEGHDLLAELDRVVPIKAFDAFPKVQSTYVERSRRGGILSLIVGGVIFLLILNDLGEYFFGAPAYSFHVDPTIEDRELQVNLDTTVAMPCHYLSIDLRDVVGDRLHLSDDFVKEGTEWDTGKAQSVQPSPTSAPSANQVVYDAHRGSRQPVTILPKSSRSTSQSSGLRALFSRLFSFPSADTPPTNPNAMSRTKGGNWMKLEHPRDNVRQNTQGFRPTANKKPAEGPDAGSACRIFGSVGVKRVAGNLHITTLGHGYMSWEHTRHEFMNLSHVIHEFSFGPFFPAISQPLDMTYTITQAPFAVFQYFLSVVPTTYIDSARRKIHTSQYAVTDYSRVVEHGKGAPGIFFKFDLEPLSMTISERTTTLYQLLIRLAGVIGGVWTTAAFALRVLTRAEKEVKVKVLKSEKEYMPSVLPTGGSSTGGHGAGDGMARRTSYYQGGL